MEFDEGLNWYVGSAVVRDECLEIHISLDGCIDERALFAITEERVRRLNSRIQTAKQYAAVSLAKQINTQWLIASAGTLSPIDLAAQFRVRSLTVYPDGTDEIVLGPEILFSGHCVIVSSDGSGKFLEATVAG
nr:DUF2262 domain-containing protein [Pseudorhodoferax sp.]